LTLVLLLEGLSTMPLSKNTSKLCNRNRVRAASEEERETVYSFQSKDAP